MRGYSRRGGRRGNRGHYNYNHRPMNNRNPRDIQNIEMHSDSKFTRTDQSLSCISNQLQPIPNNNNHFSPNIINNMNRNQLADWINNVPGNRVPPAPSNSDFNAPPPLMTNDMFNSISFSENSPNLPLSSSKQISQVSPYSQGVVRRSINYPSLAENIMKIKNVKQEGLSIFIN